MRNFQETQVVNNVVFKGSEADAITKGRALQKEADEAIVKNVAYTLRTAEDGETELVKHEVWGGGNPPYQPILHEDAAEVEA